MSAAFSSSLLEARSRKSNCSPSSIERSSESSRSSRYCDTLATTAGRNAIIGTSSKAVSLIVRAERRREAAAGITAITCHFLIIDIKIHTSRNLDDGAFGVQALDRPIIL
jgi:hypothetical protein